MQHLHAALEMARAQAHEGDAVAVLGIHVGLDLEDEAGDLVLRRLDLARRWSAAAAAAAPISGRPRSNSPTPKLFTAEPK